MKNYLLFLMIIPLLVQAQGSKGLVQYEEKIKLDIDLKLENNPNAEAIRAMIPKEQVNKKNLLFTENACLYKDAGTDKPVNMEENGGGHMFRMMMMRPNDVVYKDLNTGKITEKKDFMGREFLIRKDEKKKKWKLTDEEKDVLGHVCKKAVFRDTSTSFEAWYAPDIPVSAGPSAIGGLPGLILELHMNNDKISFKALNISKDLNEAELKAPDKGKEVTEEEYKKIVLEKTKEMKENMGGKGSNRMIIRGN